MRIPVGQLCNGDYDRVIKVYYTIIKYVTKINVILDNAQKYIKLYIICLVVT